MPQEHSLILSTVGGGVSLAPDAPAKQRAIVAALDAISTISTPQELANAVSVCQHGQALVKQVEQVGDDIRKPVRSIISRVLEIEHVFNRPIENGVKRVKAAIKQYQDAQELRAIEEARLRAEQIRQLQAQEEALNQQATQIESQLPESAEVAELTNPQEFQKAVELRSQAEDVAVEAIGVAMLPAPAVVKPAGLVGRKVWRWEITDKTAAFAARPDFFELVEKKLVIRAALGEAFDCPGIRAWQETDTQIRQT